MIRTESEYKETCSRLSDNEQRIKEQKVKLETHGLNETEIKNVMDPILSFQQQLQEEVSYYEKLKKGIFDKSISLHNLGNSLVALRIMKGLTQRELAQKLKVHDTQVSRDEKNEYFGISIEKANKILEALNVISSIRLETNSTNNDFDSNDNNESVPYSHNITHNITDNYTYGLSSQRTCNSSGNVISHDFGKKRA